MRLRMLLEIILIEHAINTKLSIKGICVILEFFSYLCNATGRKKSLEQKGSSSKRENLDKFLHQMDDSGLICHDAIRGVVHIGRMSIALSTVQRPL